MEPITLCGLVIVGVGMWVELEPVVNLVARAACGSRLIKGLSATLAAVQKPVCANRYVPYPH